MRSTGESSPAEVRATGDETLARRLAVAAAPPLPLRPLTESHQLEQLIFSWCWLCWTPVRSSGARRPRTRPPSKSPARRLAAAAAVGPMRPAINSC